MPFGNLRRKSSTKDIRHRSLFQPSAGPVDYTSPPPTAPDSSTKSAELLRPSSAAASRRPASRHANSEKPRPSLPSRPVSRRRSPARFASDSQLKTLHHDHAADRPPSPPTEAAPAPTIGISSPSRDNLENDAPRRRKFRPFGNSKFRASSYNALDRKSGDRSATDFPPRLQMQSQTSDNRPSTSTVDTTHGTASPFHEHIEFLAPRQSESSTPIRTSGERSPAILEPGSRKSSIFNFKRKKPEPLFPLPVRISPPKPASTTSSNSPTQRYSSVDLPPRGPTASGPAGSPTTMYSVAPPKLGRQGSSSSARSAHSSPPLARPPGLGARSRSGTMSSYPGRHDSDRGPLPQAQSTGRNSASTTLGRNSFVGIRSLTSRLRNPSDPYISRHGSPSIGRPGVSGGSSFAISRETLVVPPREEGETSGKYYSRLEKDLPKRNIALALSKSSDTFSHDALRSLARTFKFYEEPVDMSLRKFLWEVPLTGEAQQIDRVLTAFSERYHECNPHIFSSVDETNYVSFSLIILHSDLFNPSVKNKMQRAQYQNNTRDVGIPNEILGYFYDNIAYTEFISEDADEDDGDRKSKSAYRKARKVKAKLADPHPQKNDKQDPYEVILDEKMKIDNLKSALKEELSFEDSYTYMGTSNRFDIPGLRSAFARYGVLQIVSARSRPEAFSSPTTIDNPSESQAGVVSIKVAKVGVVWRKSPKRKKTRSPWQEWGAVLTPSQLFLCKNVSWVKSLVQQVESHQRPSKRSTPCVFKPALTEFAFECKVATTDAVALHDTNYRRHKNGFVVARRPNLEGMSQEQYFEETFLAENEAEMNDWIAKVNYAATFRSTNVRMHSWSATARRQQSNETNASIETGKDDVMTEESLRASTELLARVEAAKLKFLAAEDELARKLKKLDDSIRTARHLEILAPFMPKTRGELLTFGARLAHNIRWARFDVSRLKCQRDILFRDTQEDESATTTHGKKNELARLQERFSTQSHARSQKSGTNTAPPSIKDPARIVFEQGAHLDPRKSYEKGDLIDSIDEAFATPPEIMEGFEAHQPQGQLRLLPVDAPQGLLAVNAPPILRRNSSPTNVNDRPNSVGSVNTTQSVPPGDSNRPPSANESEKDAVPANMLSSPDGRNNKVRRSLQRTLRDTHSSQSSRGSRTRRPNKENKDSRDAEEDTSNAAVSSSGDAEALARRPGHGSFKVHGKKASVITLGSEWQQVPAEERMRLKKMALSHDGGEQRDSFVGGASVTEVDEEINSKAPVGSSEGRLVVGEEAVDEDDNNDESPADGEEEFVEASSPATSRETDGVAIAVAG